jgi:Tol biopolymer transport system component
LPAEAPPPGEICQSQRRELFLRRDRKAVALLADDGHRIIIHDLTEGTSRSLNLSEPAESIAWSYDGSKLALDNGRIISTRMAERFFHLEA